MLKTVLAFAALFILLNGSALAYNGGYTCNRNWYVATTGSDTTTCGAVAAPCATIQGANNATSIGNSAGPVQPGDCVNVAAGSYPAVIGITISVGGNANTATGYVVYKGAGISQTKLIFSSGCYNAISLTASYVILDGLDVNAANCVNGIQWGVYQMTTGQIHHINVFNSCAYSATAAGITNWSTDYSVIAGNLVHDIGAAATAATENVGISVFEPIAIPAFTPTLPLDTQKFHLQMRSNIVYNIKAGTNATPSGGVGITYGDLALASWGGGPGAYPYPVLANGNISYNNDSQGIRVQGSTAASGSWIGNNSAYNNNQNNAVAQTINRGELLFQASSNASVKNNALYAVAGVGTNTVYNTGLVWQGTPAASDTIATNDTFQGVNNTTNAADCTRSIRISGTGADAANCTTVTGANSLHDTNPQFVSLTTPDFHLAAGSPCIGAGAAAPSGYTPQTPDGQLQPSPQNIGAYNQAGSAGCF
jgi:hypothetical protein